MENIYSRIGDFFSKQAVDQATKENLRKVLSADQFAKQYPSVGRRFAGTLSGLFDKGKDFVGNIKFDPKLVKPVAQQAEKFKPMIGGIASNVLALPAMVEVFGQGKEGSFIDRNVNALAETPFGLKVNEETDIGKRAGDFLLNLVGLGEGGESNISSTEEALAKYGFNDNFELQPRNDGTFGVVRSDEGDYQDFLNRTRNSPAMQSGAFDPRELFETYKANQQFQADRKSGKLKKDRMAGERVRITMPMDLE